MKYGNREDIMAMTIPIAEMKQFFTDPEEAAAMRTRDTETMEEPPLAEAEEEEITELWAADPGNQGA